MNLEFPRMHLTHFRLVQRQSATVTAHTCALSWHSPFNAFTAGADDGVCEVVLTFTSVDKILWCNHSNEISLGVPSCGVICFKKFYKMKFGIFVEFAFGHIIYLAVKGLRWNEIWNALPVICWVHRRLRAKNRIHVYQHCFTDLTYWSWG